MTRTEPSDMVALRTENRRLLYVLAAAAISQPDGVLFVEDRALETISSDYRLAERPTRGGIEIRAVRIHEPAPRPPCGCCGGTGLYHEGACPVCGGSRLCGL